MGLQFYNPLIIVHWLQITNLVHFQLCYLSNFVGVGFEPTNSEEGGFTARSL